MVHETAQEISQLEAHLGYWLRIVSNAVSHSFARRLAAEDVSVAEWVVLRMLYEAESLAPNLLAGRMGMTKGAISKLADRLVAKGLVARGDNADDRRGRTLALTGPGRAMVPVLARIADANDAAFFDALDGAERAALETILKSLVRRRGLTAPPVD